jgi:hypothetical protein
MTPIDTARDYLRLGLAIVPVPAGLKHPILENWHLCQRIADPYGIAVYSSGGFDSLTDKHRVAQEWADGPVTVLHIGDYDPSGVHVFSALADDIGAFAHHYGGDVEFVRLAVRPEQAALYGLAVAPPKTTDRRRFEGNETWQAEALDPRDLALIVQTAIDERINRVRFALCNRLPHAKRSAAMQGPRENSVVPVSVMGGRQ